jgi:hypothetical protein
MYWSIVSEENGNIAKYAEFATQAEADAHVTAYGGFVFHNTSNVPVKFVKVNWANQTAAAMTQAEIDAERAFAAWAKLRAERDAKLAATDWIVVKSYEAGEPVPQPWINYRQALRDLPQITTDPFNPVWPVEPV